MNADRASNKLADALSLALIVVAVSAWSLYLDRFPTVSDDEPWIAAPGIGLFEHGRYASETLEGWHGAERAHPGMPPVQALLAGLSSRVFGLGLWQVRLVSLAFGLLTLVCVRALARALLGPWAAVAALVLLVFAVLSPTGLQYATGVPLADVARRARYDVPVAAFFAAGLWLCLRVNPSTRRDATCGGVCAGLAFLSHPQGAAVFLALAAALWASHASARRIRLQALAAGLACVVLPWFLYLAYHRAELLSQLGSEPRMGMTRAWSTVTTSIYELHRYEPLVRAARGYVAPWIWGCALLVGVVRAARSGTSALRGVLAAVLVIVALQALCLRPWVFHYLAPLWGPYALLAAYGLHGLAGLGRPGRIAAALACGLVLIEGSATYQGVPRRAQRITSYADLCAGLATQLPEDARVLGPPSYWLGLERRVSAYLSTNVPVGLTREYPSQAKVFEQSVERWQPDAVLLDPPLRAFLSAHESLEGPYAEIAQQMRAYLHDHFILTRRYDDPSYGRFEIWLRRF